jgi:NAD(P)H-hydrate epimerase
MQKVLTAEQMREVDRLTTEKYGIPSILLMENAAHAVARVITEKLCGDVRDKQILILCGQGNNGGDGASLGRILGIQGAQVEILLFGKILETKGDARTNFGAFIGEDFKFTDVYLSEFGELREVNSQEEKDAFIYNSFQDWDVVVDAVFGTGLTRPVEGWLANVLRDFWILTETGSRLRISVDIPSGLNSDLAYEIGERMIADCTVTFTAPKPANVLPPVSDLNGKLIIANIGSPRELIDEQASQLYLTEREDLASWLEQAAFSSSDYKSKRGHALVIAGSGSYSGAAVLAGNAAMRAGVGLVTIVTPRSSKDSVVSRILPEVMVRGVAETDGGAISEIAFSEISDLLGKIDSIAIGCGLSQGESTRDFVKKVVENRGQPTIIDADALNLLSPFAGFAANGESQFPLILTPHEGEFMRLLGTDDKDAIRDRVAAVCEFSVNNNVILVLKGERVLIGEPGGKVIVNPTGNSGLGKAGNGDTLTGILAGFVAQAAVMNIDIFETVVAAVYVAGMAGDIAEKKYGKRVMTASDVRECFSEVFEGLTNER